MPSHLQKPPSQLGSFNCRRRPALIVVAHVYPTILDITGVQMPNQLVLDGVSLVPLLDGQMKKREKPMGFMSWGSLHTKQDALVDVDFVEDTGAVWIDGADKLVLEPGGKEIALYDIFNDPAEKIDLAGRQGERVAQMRRDLDQWRQSVRASFDGRDYATQK